MASGFPSPDGGFPALDGFVVVCPTIAFPMVVEVLAVGEGKTFLFCERYHVINRRFIARR